MSKRLTTEVFTERSNKKHKNKYNYSNAYYKNSYTKVCIICPKHGEFYQTPSNHMRGRGCPTCALKKRSEGQRLTTDVFIEKAKEIHKNNYDYSNTDYKNNCTKVCIICPKHGEFYQVPHSHLDGHGCNACSYEGLKLTKKEFIEKATEEHGDNYDYSNVEFKGALMKVCIICPEHGEFYQRASGHTSGRGCPQCYKQYSKSQIEWLECMSKSYGINIQHAENGGEYHIPNSRYKADGFCEETNTIYEYHGDYHHGNPNKYERTDKHFNKTTFGELYEKTLKKEAFIREQGYNLIVMWHDDWKHIHRNIKKIQYKLQK